MRLRTFTAESMTAALALVKADLGDDALILATEEKTEGVRITAAIDPDAAEETPRPKRKEEKSKQEGFHNTDQLRYDVQHCLRFHNLPEFFIAKMTAQLSDASIASILGKGRMNIANESRHFLKLALEDICGRYFSFAPLSQQPGKLMVVGAPGIGKTLAVAKLATRAVLAGQKAVVITTDVNRAGGAEQLKSFTDILNVPLSVCADKKSLAAELKLIGRDTHLFIDTAGCNPYLDSDISTLSGFADLPGVTTALVMQAGQDAQEAIDSAEAFNALPITRLIATRTDCTRRFGGLLAAAASHNLPFSMASDSSSVADTITELTAKTLVQYLLKPL
jgi:flagellar biosynthesis protein FlhF